MSAFSQTLRCLERGVEAGLHPGAQVAVLRRGAVLLDAAVGENRPGEPLTAGHLMPWLSAGKPLTAVAILRLWEQDKLDLDAPIVEVMPEFAAHGKHAITTHHVLTHTAGFRDGDKVSEHLDWEAAIARVCAATLEPAAIPGTTAAYHVSGSWFILGELIRRIDGRMPDQFVREEVCAPCGMMESWMALPPAELERNQRRLGLIHLTSPPAVELHAYLNRERAWLHPRPGSTLRGPVRDLARFYATLLADKETGEGRLLHPDTIQQMTARQRAGGFDLTFQHVIDWGWGVIINSNCHGRSTVPYGFGLHASDAAFGHGVCRAPVVLPIPNMAWPSRGSATACPARNFTNCAHGRSTWRFTRIWAWRTKTSSPDRCPPSL